MRLCVAIPCFFRDMDFCDAIRRVGALGFDAAETYNWKGLEPEAVRNACLDAGVELLSMCTTSFELTRPEFRKTWLSGLRESCEMARKMGVGRLITQVGNDCGRDRRYQHESIVEGLRAAVPVLEEYGVILMPEPLNTLVDHPGYYLSRSDEAFEIIREVGHPLVKLVFDMYHQQVTEGNIIPNITRNLDCIAHLHGAGHPGRHEMQFGESDYRNIFAALDKAGYTGACGLEYGPQLPPEESLITARTLFAEA